MTKKQDQKYIKLHTIEGPCFDDEKLEVILREIGARVKIERNRQNLSVAQLAEISNLNVTHLYRTESGEKPLGLKGLIKIAIALNMPISYFIPFEQVEYIPAPNVARFIELTKDFDEETLEFVFDFITHLRDSVEVKKNNKNK